jgi:putative redox protein
MKLKLKTLEAPFVLELNNENGSTVIIDANPSIGGKGLGFRPMELLAGSLASCASIDVISILKKQRIELASYTIDIVAKRFEGVPSPFENIQLNFEFDDSVDLEKAKKAIDLSLEKYCSVSASLKDEITITYSINSSL